MIIGMNISLQNMKTRQGRLIQPTKFIQHVFFFFTIQLQVSLILHESEEKPKVPANDQTANPARKVLTAASMRTRRRRLI